MTFSNQLNIQLEGIGKKFGSEWIFKNIDYSIEPSAKMVILGGNGSGKSTLLQIISGYILPNQGKIKYKNGHADVEQENFKDKISLASPYLDLIDEFSLSEIVHHCALYKPFLQGIDPKQIPDISELSHTKDKPVKLFSSGMKQRLKLALAVLAEAPVLLLDEPVSNLDKNAIRWYQAMIAKYASHKTIIVCSNSIREEFEFCTTQLDLANYK